MCQYMNVIGLVRNGEQYVFTFVDSDRDAMLRVLARFASDAELSFTWFDARVLASASLR